MKDRKITAFEIVNRLVCSPPDVPCEGNLSDSDTCPKAVREACSFNAKDSRKKLAEEYIGRYYGQTTRCKKFKRNKVVSQTVVTCAILSYHSGRLGVPGCAFSGFCRFCPVRVCEACGKKDYKLRKKEAKSYDTSFFDPKVIESCRLPMPEPEPLQVKRKGSLPIAKKTEPEMVVSPKRKANKMVFGDDIACLKEGHDLKTLTRFMDGRKAFGKMVCQKCGKEYEWEHEYCSNNLPYHPEPY